MFISTFVFELSMNLVKKNKANNVHDVTIFLWEILEKKKVRYSFPVLNVVLYTVVFSRRYSNRSNSMWILVEHFLVRINTHLVW